MNIDLYIYINVACLYLWQILWRHYVSRYMIGLSTLNFVARSISVFPGQYSSCILNCCFTLTMPSLHPYRYVTIFCTCYINGVVYLKCTLDVLFFHTEFKNQISNPLRTWMRYVPSVYCSILCCSYTWSTSLLRCPNQWSNHFTV